MLSGGMDSSSIVAVARRMLAEEGEGRFQHVSATAPDASTVSRPARSTPRSRCDGLESHTVHYGQLGEFMPELGQLTVDADEPFDFHMTLLRLIYLAAHRRGTKVLLDGGAATTSLPKAATWPALLLADGG